MKSVMAILLPFLALLAPAYGADAALRGVLFPKMRHNAELASTSQTVQTEAAPTELDDGEDDDAPQAPVPSASADATPPEGAVSLPTVEALAGTAAEKMKKLHSQASILEARIAQTQRENEAKLARQKAIFEQKLKTQEESNRDVMDVNANISATIKRLKTGNADLRKKAKELQDGNHLKQVELQTLKAKLQNAESFISESLQATNDQHAKELGVLQSSSAGVAASAKGGKKQQPSMFRASGHAEGAAAEEADEKEETDDVSTKADDKADTSSESHKAEKKGKGKGKESEQQEDEEETDEDEQDADDQESDDSSAADASAKGESFVSVRSKVRRIRVRRRRQEMDQFSDDDPAPTAAQSNAQPSDLLAVLTSGVENLAKEEKASDAKLKSLFMTNFKKGTKRHTALLSQQKALRQEKANLEALQKKLQVAVDHLEDTKATLKERLRGLGLFLQRLGHLAVAPASETQHLLKSLPEKVGSQAAASGKDSTEADSQ